MLIKGCWVFLPADHKCSLPVFFCACLHYRDVSASQLLNAPARRRSGTQKWKGNNVMDALPFREFVVISCSLIDRTNWMSAYAPNSHRAAAST